MTPDQESWRTFGATSAPRIVTESGDQVALVFRHSSRTVTKARAQLLATAPRLLRALEAVQGLTEATSEELAERADAVHAEVIAAIAEARRTD